MSNRVRLGDVCDIRAGGTPSRSNPQHFGGQVPWAKVADITRSAGRVRETEEFLTVEGLSAIRGRLFPPGTILLAQYGSVGELGVADVELAANQAVLGITVPPGGPLDASYLLAWLRSMRGRLLASAKGVAQQNISATLVRDLRVSLPPLDEQRRIAAILDRADSVAHRVGTVAETLQRLRSAVFLEIVGDPVRNDRCWPHRALGTIGAHFTYGTAQKCDVTQASGQTPVLRIPNVAGGRISWHALKFADLPESERASLALRRGDMLIVRSNGNPDFIGRSALFDGVRPATFASYLIRIRLPARGGVTPEFLHALFESEPFRRELRRRARSTAGNYNIGIEGLSELPLVVPPLDVQERLARSLERVRLVEHRAAAMLHEAGTMSAALADRAFCGEL